jgi:hypothetical protein
MTFRIISGVVGLTILVGAALLALNLLAMEPGASVLLAGYMAIGCVMLGVYLLFFAFSGEWRPDLTSREKKR